MIRVEEARGLAGLAQLESTWDALCREHETSSFFLSHAWFRCCLDGLPADVEVVTLVLRDGAATVGIAPLLLRRTSWRIFPARLVALLHNQDSPFSDLIVAPGREDTVVRAVVEHLQRRPGWDLCSVDRVDQHSPTWAAVARAFDTGASLRVAAGSSPILELDQDWGTFWSGQSQRFKKTVRNVANRLERLGAVDVRNEAVSESAGHCLDVFRAVASRSWKADLPISATRNPHIARFFESLTRTLHDTRRLMLWVLRVDGQPIATEYHVRDGQTVYALRSDFDERHGGASPGAYLNAAIVRAYFADDLAVYDMGPGDRDYKQRWATAARARDTFWLFNRSGYGTALYLMERRAVPQLRRVREWWRGPLRPVEHA